MDKKAEREKQENRMAKQKDEQNKAERVKEHDKKIKQERLEQEQKINAQVKKIKMQLLEKFDDIKSKEKLYASQYDKYSLDKLKSDIDKEVESFEKKTTEEKSKGLKEFSKKVDDFFNTIHRAKNTKYYIKKESVNVIENPEYQLREDWCIRNFKDGIQIASLIDNYFINEKGFAVNKPIQETKTETEYKTIFIYKNDVFIRVYKEPYLQPYEDQSLSDYFELFEINLFEFIKRTHRFLMPDLITNLFGFIQKNNLCTLDEAETERLSSLKDEIIDLPNKGEKKFKEGVDKMSTEFVELIKTGLKNKISKDGSKKRSNRKSQRKSQRRSRRKSNRKSKRKSNRKSKRKSNRKSNRRSN